MGDNGKGGVKNGWQHLWTAPDVQNKQKSKAKNDFLKNICMEHLLTYGDDYCQNIHEREKFDSKNKCVDEISQRQCINNG